MTERWTAFFLLAGGVLAVLALWYLSVAYVRRDTLRRGLGEVERKGWVAATSALPLLGFALYLFTILLRGYLNAAPEPEEAGRVTAVKARPADWIPSTGQRDGETVVVVAALDPPPVQSAAAQHPVVEPAQGSFSAVHSTEVAAPRLAAGRFLLVVSQGPHAGQQYALQRLPLRLGRGPDAGIALDDDLNVSRSHAELYAGDGALRIRDLDSMHGTKVNDVPVSDQAVQPGDRISVGGTTFILREQF